MIYSIDVVSPGDQNLVLKARVFIYFMYFLSKIKPVIIEHLVKTVPTEEPFEFSFSFSFSSTAHIDTNIKLRNIHSSHHHRYHTFLQAHKTMFSFESRSKPQNVNDIIHIPAKSSI